MPTYSQLLERHQHLGVQKEILHREVASLEAKRAETEKKLQNRTATLTRQDGLLRKMLSVDVVPLPDYAALRQRADANWAQIKGLRAELQTLTDAVKRARESMKALEREHAWAKRDIESRGQVVQFPGGGRE